MLGLETRFNSVISKMRQNIGGKSTVSNSPIHSRKKYFVQPWQTYKSSPIPELLYNLNAIIPHLLSVEMTISKKSNPKFIIIKIKSMKRSINLDTKWSRFKQDSKDYLMPDSIAEPLNSSFQTANFQSRTEFCPFQQFKQISNKIPLKRIQSSQLNPKSGQYLSQQLSAGDQYWHNYYNIQKENQENFYEEITLGKKSPYESEIYYREQVNKKLKMCQGEVKNLKNQISQLKIHLQVQGSQKKFILKNIEFMANVFFEENRMLKEENTALKKKIQKLDIENTNLSSSLIEINKQFTDAVHLNFSLVGKLNELSKSEKLQSSLESPTFRAHLSKINNNIGNQMSQDNLTNSLENYQRRRLQGQMLSASLKETKSQQGSNSNGEGSQKTKDESPLARKQKTIRAHQNPNEEDGQANLSKQIKKYRSLIFEKDSPNERNSVLFQNGQQSPYNFDLTALRTKIKNLKQRLSKSRAF